MKKEYTRIYANKQSRNFITFIILLFIFQLLIIPAKSQVVYTQTTNADFNKGFHENVLIFNDNVSLPIKGISDNNWYVTTDLPRELTGHKIIRRWNNAILIGGYDGSQYRNEVYRSTFQNPGIGSWTSMNSLPTNLSFHAVVVSPNYIYVLGGRNSGSPFSNIYYASLNADGSIGTWQTSTVSLPSGLWGHTANYVNGYIIVAGGTDQISANTAVNSVYYSRVGPNGELSTFTATSSLPDSRNGHTMESYDDKLYVIGGQNNSGTNQNTVYYSTVNNDGTCSPWQTTPTNLPVSLSNHSSSCYNGVITVIGGESGGILTNNVYYTDIDDTPNFTWNLSLNNVFDPRVDGQAFAFNGQIIFAGGEYLTGLPIKNSRYTSLSMGTDRVSEATFISNYKLDTELDFDNIDYNMTYNSSFSGYEILYRTAASDEIWSAWVSGAQNNPLILGINDRYIEYMYKFTTTGTNNITLHDISLTISGYTTLNGNLDGIDTLKIEDSPFWVSGNISFTSGTHVIDPGVIIVFDQNTGLEIGQANLKCEGTVSDSILLTYYGNDPEMWNGVYFNTNSDNGVSSSLSYTKIEQAGNGTWNSNLYCYNTNTPSISHCVFKEAEGHGIRLGTADLLIEDSKISGNTEHGLVLTTSITSLINVDITNSGGSGIYYNNTASSLTSFNCSLVNNENGIYYPTSNTNFPLINNDFSFVNNTIGITMPGATISNDKTWGYIDGGYAILGDMNINLYTGNPRLTIEAGNIIRFATGFRIRVGSSGSYGGELQALGTADSTITFTSLDTAGTWNGIMFDNGSDSYSSTSNLQHCIVEKGNAYNIYCNNSNHPGLISNCEIKNSPGIGLQLYVSTITVSNTIIENNHTGFHDNNSSSATLMDNVVIQNNINTGIWSNSLIEMTNSQIINNGVYEVYASAPNGYPKLTNSSIQEGVSSKIVIGGGTQTVNRTWIYCSNGYEITGVVSVSLYTEKPRLTINGGSILRFASTGKISIGTSGSYGGELQALGNADSIITFTALDPGGVWGGIQFNNGSDSFGGSSLLNYCLIEKGNTYNVYCNATNQPLLIDNCQFNNSPGNGLQLETASTTINNTIFQNNHTGLYNNNGTIVSYLDNCIIQNNTNTGIRSNVFIEMTNSLVTNNTIYEINAASPNGFPKLTNTTIQEVGNSKMLVGAGTQTVDRIWPYCSNGYEITGVVTVSLYTLKPRLTIDAGNVLRFATAGKIRVGTSGSNGGELHAIGTADSTITFTALDPGGVWQGIQFDNGGDSFGATSYMQYCIIEKGNTYNIYCNNTNQPSTIGNCKISNSMGIGLNLNTASIAVESCQVINNGSYGIYVTGASNPVIGNTYGASCDLYYNGIYDIYNNTINTINAGNNFWNTSDTALINSRIYDYYDLSSRGIVYHYPIKLFGINPTDQFTISGKVRYNNVDSTELNGFTLHAKDIEGSIQDFVSSNASGDYLFSGLPNANYTFEGSSIIWGGVNSTDALRIMQHYTYINQLGGLPLRAADVNGSNSVNGTDALFVMKRFAFLISSFPAGDWILSDSTILYGDNQIINQMANCFGDVDTSYVPPGKEVSTISLIADGSMGITSFEEYEIPIKVKNSLEMGALSLILNYSEEYIEIEDIVFSDGSASLIHTAENGIIRNAWADLNPILFEDDEILLTLMIKTKDLSGLTGNISFGLGTISEIANSNAEVIDGVILTAPELVYGLTSTNEGLDLNGLSVSNYPDPFNLNTTIEYTLPQDGNVLLQVFNSIGKQEDVLIDEFQIAGNYKIDFDRNNLQAGLYFYKLTFISKGNEHTIVKKMIINR